MMNRFTSPVRTMLLAAILAFAALAADARATDVQSQPFTTSAATRTTGRTKNDTTSNNEGIPVGGILIIIGIVGGIILLAWIASRISDNRPSMP
jgi:hypothetical protein